MLPKARAKLRLLHSNDDPMSEERHEDGVADETETAEVEGLTPDHHEFPGDERVAHEAMEAVGDQVSRCVCWCWSAAPASAESIEADRPHPHSDDEQSAAAPGSEQRRKRQHCGEQVVRRRGQNDHEDAEE